MGYRFQFITLAGFHSLNASMFELAQGYAAEGMPAYVAPSGARVRARGATATPRLATSARSAPATSTPCSRRVTGGDSSTLALAGSTEEAQFDAVSRVA